MFQIKFTKRKVYLYEGNKKLLGSLSSFLISIKEHIYPWYYLFFSFSLRTNMTDFCWLIISHARVDVRWENMGNELRTRFGAIFGFLDKTEKKSNIFSCAFWTQKWKSKNHFGIFFWQIYQTSFSSQKYNSVEIL